MTNKSSDKISFDELLKSGDIESDDAVAYSGDLFEDTPKTFDFTVLVLSIIAVLCIGGCVIHSASAMRPIKANISVSGTNIQNHMSESSSQYKNKAVNINTADIATLCTLKYIGESKALSIIAYREANGPFKSISDIKKVSGIGEKTFEAIKDKICI